MKRDGPVFPIIFKGSEVLPPHDDSLVITIKIAHYEMHRILVDNGCYSNLLYMSMLLDIGHVQISSLHSFSSDVRLGWKSVQHIRFPILVVMPEFHALVHACFFLIFESETFGRR